MAVALGSTFHSRLNTYESFAEELGSEKNDTDDIVKLLYNASKRLKEEEDLPEEIEDLLDFVMSKRISLHNRNEKTWMKLLDKVNTALEYIEKDIDENIWDLMEQDVDPVSLEYTHSLITRSIKAYRDMTQTSVDDNVSELKENSQRYLKGFYYGIDRLVYLNSYKEFDKDELEAMDSLETQMEKNNHFVPQNDEVNEITINASLV